LRKFGGVTVECLLAGVDDSSDKIEQHLMKQAGLSA